MDDSDNDVTEYDDGEPREKITLDVTEFNSNGEI